MQCRQPFSLLIAVLIQHVKLQENEANPEFESIMDFGEDDFGFDPNIAAKFYRTRLELEREGFHRKTSETILELDHSLFEMPDTTTENNDMVFTTKKTFIELYNNLFFQSPDEYEDSNSGENDDEEDRNNPCNYDKFAHPQPTINRVGRRVSDIKCEEYALYYWYNVSESRRNQIKCKEIMGADGSSVHGGEEAKEGDFPHMGAVGWRFPRSTKIKFLCGSSLISPKFTLTAAHCQHANKDIYEDRDKPYLVRFGSVYIGDESVKTKNHIKDVLIEKFIVMDEYEKHPAWKYYDIALIELKDEIEILSNIRPACLWNGGLGGNWVANITGWGKTKSGLPTDHLRHAEVDIFEKQTCKRYLQGRQNRNWKRGLVDHQLCAGKSSGFVDTCQGDSGGPLQILQPMPRNLPGEVHHIVGVTSFGISCAHPLLPSIYINVTSFLCWIETTVWPGEHNEFCKTLLSPTAPTISGSP